jgi:hypothetical protein
VTAGSVTPGPVPTGPLSRKVLEFEAVMKRLVKAAKDPAFTVAEWAPLAAYAATGEFERVGTWLEVMNWEQYTAFLTQWATASLGFDTVLRRISELPGLVYLELEERHTRPDGVSVVNSLSVYEFNDDRKIRHLDVYLQQPR